MLTTSELHEATQPRLRAHRERVAPRLRSACDGLLERHGFLTEDTKFFTHPLAQPILAFPTWVADAVTDGGRHHARIGDALVDAVESTIMGYLYVRVHDDLFDEGIGEGDSAMLLADSFLLRHTALLSRHVSSTRFWTFFERTAAAYSEAMLFERAVTQRAASCSLEDFDRVLDRSQPLVLPGAALLDLADRWELLEPLQRFVRHAARAGQIVDDIRDCERDAAAGNYTWVVRYLGGVDEPERMYRRLLEGGIDDLVGIMLGDIDHAEDAACEVGMAAADGWLAARREGAIDFRNRVVRSVFC